MDKDVSFIKMHLPGPNATNGRRLALSEGMHPMNKHACHSRGRVQSNATIETRTRSMAIDVPVPNGTEARSPN